MMINTVLLASAMKEKRKQKALREVASEIGDVSFVTLSRIEQGKLPDIVTYIKVCKWLDVSTESFIEISFSNENISTKERIVSYIKSDKNLNERKSGMLVDFINFIYTEDH